MNRKINLSEHDFINKYWYTLELKRLAKKIGILNVSKIRKDELEKIILKYIKTGILEYPKNSKKNYKKNSEDILELDTIIKYYKNNKKTWIFISREVCKIQPDFKAKSGVKYWLNRWREKEIQKGNTITYGDLINEYIRLNNIDRLPQIPSAKFNNFITDFLKNEKNKTRVEAIRIWKKVKRMNLPKNYLSWKKAKLPSKTNK